MRKTSCWSPDPGETVRVRWWLSRPGEDDLLVREIAGCIEGKDFSDAYRGVEYELTDGRKFTLTPKQVSETPAPGDSYLGLPIVWAEAELVAGYGEWDGPVDPDVAASLARGLERRAAQRREELPARTRVMVCPGGLRPMWLGVVVSHRNGNRSRVRVTEPFSSGLRRGSVHTVPTVTVVARPGGAS